MSSPDFAQQWVGSQEGEKDNAPLALRAFPPSGSEPSFGRPFGGHSTATASAQYSVRIEDSDSASQQEALEALANRVNAARSVV